MAWGAFYRPSDASFVGEHIANVYPSARLPPWSNRYPPSRPPSPPPPPPKKPIPQFRRPLAQTVFNDPAFSSDPRSHPHFDVADARSYKDLPPRPPRRSPSMYDPAAQENITWPAPAVLPHHPMTVDRRLSPLALSVSLEHEPILTSSGSSTVSSATSNSSSPTQTPGIHTTSPVSRTMPHSFRPTPYAKFPPSAPAQAPDENRPRMPYTMSTPDVRPPRPPPPPPRVSSAPDLPVTRKRSDKIKNFVRRLTKRDNLDRIDELDETDPFGLGFHHSGPYEAITNNLAKLGPLDSAADDLTGRMNPSKRKVNRASAPPPGRAAINDSSLPADIFAEADNTSNESSAHNVQVERVPIPGRRYCDPAASNIRPDHIGTQILRDQPLGSYPPDNRDFPSQPALRVHYFGDTIPHVPGVAPSHMNSVSAPYVPNGGIQTGFPPNYREPGWHTPSPPPPSDIPHLISQPGRPLGDSPPRQAPPHRSARSLDIPRIHNGQTANSDSKPPRVQHLPRRLVMPAPLQPQSQSQPPPAPPRQLRYAFPNVDDQVHVGRRTVDVTTEMPGVNRGRKLLRKRSASLSGLPVQPSIPRSGGSLMMRKNPSITALEGERTQQGTGRRRRLSKRRVDI